MKLFTSNTPTDIVMMTANPTATDISSADMTLLVFEGSYDRVAAFARQWEVDQLDRGNSAGKGTAERLISGAAPLFFVVIASLFAFKKY